MATMTADEDEEVAPPPLLANLVFQGGDTNEHYAFCHLDLSGQLSTVITNLIAIAEVNSKVLVAVPHSAWSRSVSTRFLPRIALSKVVLVEVPGMFISETDGGDSEAKVWVGFLHEDLHNFVRPGSSNNPEHLDFLDNEGRNFVPGAHSLVSVANEQFGFFSMDEDEEQEPELEAVQEPAAEEVASAAKAESRIAALEEDMKKIRDAIAALPAQLAGNQQKHQAAPTAAVLPPRPREEAAPIDGLDPGVLASARQAGVPEAQLRKFAGLVAKQPRMADLPRGPQKRANVLSESEDEEDEEQAAEAEGGGSPSGPVEKAVLQLTKLVSVMVQRKKTSKGIEAILERSDGGGHEAGSSSSSASRSKAAAYQKLKSALTNKPEWLYQLIEDKLEEDFLQLRTAPGSSAVSATSRGWLEHRSRLGHFPATIRFAWIIAGVHDCLRQGDPEQARARCALALAATDQSALDGGNWSLAQEFLLELPPPYQSFSNKKMPEQHEQIATRLADDRLMELLMWRLKDRDSFLESKKRLTAAKPKPVPPVPTPKPGPKWQPKGKAKASSPGEEGGGSTA